MDIDLKLLQHAVVLARHRHFGRAASALRISQPTLSRNIAALEKKLGMRVFERSRRDVVATSAGDDVLKMADELVARAEAISNQLQVVRDGRGGRLRVAAGSYIHDIAVAAGRHRPDQRQSLDSAGAAGARMDGRAGDADDRPRRFRRVRRPGTEGHAGAARRNARHPERQLFLSRRPSPDEEEGAASAGGSSQVSVCDVEHAAHQSLG